MSIVCASSSAIEKDIERFLVKSEKGVSEMDGAIRAEPVGARDSRAACTIGVCINLCYGIMNPPFYAWCSGNTCWCQKA